MAELGEASQISGRVAQCRESEARQKLRTVFPSADALFLMPALRRGQAEHLFRTTALDIAEGKEAGEIAPNDLVGRIAFDALGAGIPADDLAARVHQVDRMILDTVEEHPIAIFALPELLFHQPALPLQLRQMGFGRLAHADVADRRRHQNALGAFQRTQHELDRKLATILASPNEFDPGANLLRQRLGRGSSPIGEQPFRESFRNDGRDLLTEEVIAAISKLLFRLKIQQDDFAILVHDHHRVRGRLKQF